MGGGGEVQTPGPPLDLLMGHGAIVTDEWYANDESHVVLA